MKFKFYNKTIWKDKSKKQNNRELIVHLVNLKMYNFKNKYKIIIYENRNKKNFNHIQLIISENQILKVQRIILVLG